MYNHNCVQNQQFTSFRIVVLGYGGTCMMSTVRMQQKKFVAWFAALCNTYTLFMFGNRKMLRMPGLCPKVFMTTPFVEISKVKQSLKDQKMHR